MVEGLRIETSITTISEEMSTGWQWYWSSEEVVACGSFHHMTKRPFRGLKVSACNKDQLAMVEL